MKIIRSVRNARGTTFQKQPAGGTGRIRCMKCQSICVQQQLGDGTRVLKCLGCGATHSSTALDRPKVAAPGALPKRAAR